MSNKLIKGIACLVILPPLVVACSSDDDDNAGGGTPTSVAVGAIYAMNNSPDTNSISSYTRAADGTLTFLTKTATEGRGTGPVNVASGPGGMAVDPLASNYSLVMSSDNNYVLAVNAGSDQVSSLAVQDDFSLTHVSTVSSGGTDPISIATNGNTVFVANSNTGEGTIAAFTLGADGALTSVGEPTTLAGRPTALAMTQDNTTLLTTLVDTNQIQVFSVEAAALTQTQLFSYDAPPEGRDVQNPFGLATFAKGDAQFAIVGEARVFDSAGEIAPQTSSVATFSVSGGMLTPISVDVRTDADGDDSMGPITTCWVITNADSSLAFTANTNSNNLSAFALDTSGTATLSTSLAFEGVGDFTDVGLTDQIMIGDVVYQLTAVSGEVISLRAGAAGALSEIDREAGNLAAAGGNQGITGF